MAARFPQGEHPEFPVHCIGTRKLPNQLYNYRSHALSAHACQFTLEGIKSLRRLRRRRPRHRPSFSSSSSNGLI